MPLRAVCSENIQNAKKSIDSREEHMTTAGMQGATRRDLETQLIEKAWKDPEFKAQVVTVAGVAAASAIGTASALTKSPQAW
jgi:hypothetical protein